MDLGSAAQEWQTHGFVILPGLTFGVHNVARRYSSAIAMTALGSTPTRTSTNDCHLAAVSANAN